jgi:hypothetical protein
VAWCRQERYSGKLYCFCRLTNKIRATKSRKVRLVRHVARVEVNSLSILVGNIEDKRPFMRNVSYLLRIILK